MPVYEYATAEGHTTLLRRSVEERDAPVAIDGRPARRVAIPSRLMIGTGAKPETMSDKTWKGYRKLELDGKLQDRPGYLPAATVKAALSAPEFE
jgi:hypothetical protein